MSIATEAAAAPPAVQTGVIPGSMVDPGNHSASTGNSSTLAVPPAKVNLLKPKVLKGWYKIRALGKKDETRRETLTTSFSKREHSGGNVSPKALK